MSGNVSLMGVAGPTSDPLIQVKEVFWRPSTSTTIAKIGQAVCYNSDLAADYKERATTPVDSQAASNNTGTPYAEGSQTYNARIFVVEEPAAGNLNAFAGVVLELGPNGGADGDKLKIAVPNGVSMIPVLTDQNCVQGATVLAVKAGSAAFTAPSAGASRVVAVAEETVDRSAANGLVWARVRPVVPHGVVVEDHTANDTLLAAESGSIHTNAGASGAITLTLPSGAPAGTIFTFVVAAVQNLAIKAGNNDKIILGNDSDALADGEALTLTPGDANDVGMCITLVALSSGDWLPISVFALKAATLVIP
jgi:hypothetical protein